MNSDFHVHTRCSPDSSSPVEAVIAIAVERGLTALALTDHVEVISGKPRYDSPICASYAEYEKVITAASARYQDRIKTLMGAEVGYRIEYEPQIAEFLRKNRYDMIIGSIHDSPPLDWWDPNTGPVLKARPDLALQALTWYFTQLLGAASSGLFDVIAHIDVYERYFPGMWPNVFKEPSLSPLVERTVKAIAECSRMEINLAMYNQRGEFAWSALPFLTMYREMGGRPPAVGSDSHRLAWVGLHVPRAEELAREAGFDEVASWEDVVATRKRR